MVFELMKQDLRQAMKIYTKNEGFVFSTLSHYALQIGYGLKALQEMQIIHADLKLDNVLMSLNKSTAKICDFGTSMEASKILVTNNLQPRFYRAPEVILWGRDYDCQIDVWSYGCMLYEL